MRLKSLRCTALALTACAMLPGCAPTIQRHGYVPPQSDISRVRPGVDTAETAVEILGRPSSSGVLGDTSWYYVQSTVENFTWHAPKVVDRTVLAVDFTADGRVRNITRYGLRDGRIVALETRTTDTGGRKMGVLEQLFGNLLNLDAAQFEDQ